MAAALTLPAWLPIDRLPMLAIRYGLELPKACAFGDTTAEGVAFGGLVFSLVSLLVVGLFGV